MILTDVEKKIINEQIHIQGMVSFLEKLEDNSENKIYLKKLLNFYSTTNYAYNKVEDGVIKPLTKPVEPMPVEKFTLTITATPIDAVIKIDNIIQSSITIDKGSVVSYIVSKPGYVTQTASKTVNSTETIQIILIEESIVDPAI